MLLRENYRRFPAIRLVHLRETYRTPVGTRTLGAGFEGSTLGENYRPSPGAFGLERRTLGEPTGSPHHPIRADLRENYRLRGSLGFPRTKFIVPWRASLSAGLGPPGYELTSGAFLHPISIDMHPL
jgi:hypothetical protein